MTTTTEQLNQILTFLNDGMRSATDWTLQQAPLVAQELIHYTIVVGIIAVVIAAVLVVIFALLYAIAMVDAWRSEKRGEIEAFVPVVVMCGGVFVLATLVTCGIASDYVGPAIKAKVAPRVFLLDYVRDIID